MTRKLFALAAALTAWMLPATAADTATFCVGAPTGCSGTATTLAAAITAARGSAESDVIRLGPGNHDAAQLQVDSDLTTDGQLEIAGEGATGTGATVLTRDPAHSTPLINDASTMLRDVRIVPPESPGAIGLDLFRGEGRRLSIVNTGSAVSSHTGVRLADGAQLRESAVALANFNSNAVNVIGTGAMSLVVDSVVDGDCYGIYSSGAPVLVGRTTVAAGFPVVINHANAVVQSSLLRLESDSCITDAAVTLQGDGTSGRTLDVDNVTAIGSGSGTSRGVRLHRQSGTALMQARVRNSFFSGFADTLQITDATGATPPVAAFSASAFDFASAAGDYTAPGEPNFDNPVPGFVDQASGDFRLRHNSFLVDRAEATPALDPGPSDLARQSRFVDGNPAINGTSARRDVGAYEYQRLAPTVTGTVTPASAAVGQALSFGATGGAGDPGESVTYAWAFDDGTNAAGANVSKSFTQAGGHTATVTATDDSGRTTSANVAFNVTAPAATAPAPPTLGGQDPAPVGGAGALPTGGSFTVAFAARTGAVDRRRRVGVRLRCPANAPRACAGRLTLTATRRGRSVRLGRKSFSIARGRTATVRVPLSPAGRTLLRGSGRLSVRAAATVTGGRTARLALQVRRRP